MLNKTFLEDMNLSLKAKGLLAFCMSKPDGWQFNVLQLTNVLKEGKDALYATFRELIESGYCIREQFRATKGKFGKSDYLLYETPRSLENGMAENPDTENPDTDDPRAAEPDAAPYILVSNDDSNKYMSELPFGRMASSFYEKIKSINPKVKPPNIHKWAKDFELLAKDGNTIEEIEKVINYLLSTAKKPSSNGFCWAHKVLSPAKLRIQFAMLWAEMSSLSSSYVSTSEPDEKLVKQIMGKFKNRSDLTVGHNYLEFNNGMTVAHFKFGEKDFKIKCFNELRKRNLNVENL